MKSRRITAFAATVAALALAPSVAQATFPGANGRIAFWVSDNPFVHTIRPNGSHDQRLAAGSYPSWSADGEHIVYSGVIDPFRTAIFTMRADGSQQQRLTSFSADPGGYSPSGRRIVFTRSFSRQNLIATMRSDGTDQQVLARGKVYGPLYSPAGGQIAYTAPSRTTGNGASAVWVMRPDGSRKRQLTDPDRRHPEGPGDYSPDGRHIIFGRGGLGPRSGVFVMRSNGSDVHRLDCGGVYSPNGRRFAYAGQVGAYEVDIFTSTVRCTDPFRVTYYGQPATMIGAQDPSWQPLPGG